jgi:chemotaxis protein methyltransferase WspC
LHRAGIPLDKIEIDAVDISKRALVKAKRAIYGKNSFRGIDEAIQEKYFVKGGAGYRLIEEVRGAVNFRQGNFLVGSLSPQPDYYDAIFCRNLLIYFDRATQKAALEKLHRALKERGVLFVGHAETSQVARDLFVQLYSARSFGYMKVDEEQRRQNKRDTGLPDKVPDQWQSVFDQLAKLTSSEKTPRKPVVPAKALKPLKSPSDDNVAPKISLISVERLANKGKYVEAIDLCLLFLKQNPESAQAYYLLGLVKDLNGDSQEADNCLRKAIYLNPNHEQALVLAALLAEKRGDLEAAMSYKRRARRVADRNVDHPSVA